MRAAKWNSVDAQKRIKGTLEWRRDFKPDIIPPDEVKIESETGKMYAGLCSCLFGLGEETLIAFCSILNGFDMDGRPILYMRPGRENTERSPRQVRHLVWCLYATLSYHS